LKHDSENCYKERGYINVPWMDHGQHRQGAEQKNDRNQATQLHMPVPRNKSMDHFPSEITKTGVSAA
jgi:hypothetical protein